MSGMTERAVVLRFPDDVDEADRAELDVALRHAGITTTRGVDLGHRGPREDLVLAVVNVVRGVAGLVDEVAETGRDWLRARRRPSALFEIEDGDTRIVVQISADDPDHALQRLTSALASASDGPIRWQGGAWRSPEAATSELAKTVFVIHGRDKVARQAVFDFLRAIGLHPIEWNEALAATGRGAPYLGDVLDQVLGTGAAVIVLQTPDDEVRLKAEHAKGEDDPDLVVHGQARPNVIFEAGMAFARRPDVTVIVEFGKVRPFTDIGGRYIVRLDNTPEMKNRLAGLLRTVGCAVNTSGSDWLRVDLTPPAPKGGSSFPTTTSPAGRTSNSNNKPVLGNYSVTVDSLGMHTVHGEARTDGAPVSWLTLKATFYGQGKITGTAIGFVKDLEPGETKTFSLTTNDDVHGYDNYTVQIESAR